MIIFKNKSYKIFQTYDNAVDIFSYIICHKGEAIVIDPVDDCGVIENVIKENNCRLSKIFLTHEHCNFLANHLKLSKLYNCDIYCGRNNTHDFTVIPLFDNQELQVNDLLFKILETPGRTMDSISIILSDYDCKTGSFSEKFIFTGGILGNNNIGLPDLCYKNEESIDFLSKKLFNSINKIKNLNKNLKILPGIKQHLINSDSFINKNKEDCIGIQKELKVNTIKHELKTNKFLQILRKEDFCDNILELMPHPLQLKYNRMFLYNRKYILIEEFIKNNIKKINVSEFEDTLKSTNNYYIIDTRDPNLFSEKYIKGSMNFPIDFGFTILTNHVLNYDKEIIIINYKDNLYEALNNLIRQGYYNIKGYINYDDIKDLNNDYFETTDFVEVSDFVDIYKNNSPDKLDILDIRTHYEWENGHIKNSKFVEFLKLKNYLNLFNPLNTNYIYCKSGRRTILASSYLKYNGINNIKVIKGGYNSLLYTGIKIAKIIL